MVFQKNFSCLPLVERVDAWPYYQRNPALYKEFMSNYYYFMIEPYEKPFGYVHSSFVEVMTWPSFWHIDRTARILKLTRQHSFEERSKAMNATLRKGNEEGRDPSLRKWFNEFTALFSADWEHVLDMDTSGVDVFGVVCFGVFLTIYVKTGEEVKYWVPRRARSKKTFPGMLDNAVGGNLISTESPLEGIIRETAEETGIPAEYTRANIKACGTVSYQMAQTNQGMPGCMHQIQYVYEMEVGPDLVLKGQPHEIEEFKLMSLQEVCDALVAGEFKPNCTMTWLAFLVRHGFVSAENDTDFLEVCARLNRKHDLFLV